MRFLLLLAFLAGCGKAEPNHTATGDDLAAVRAKYTDYLKWSDDVVAPRKHWVTGGCDDALFSGLRGMFDLEVTLTNALRSPGEWARRDLTQFPDCYPGVSKNRTSRDMATGEAMWMIARHRPELARDVLDYANAHEGRLGDGDFFTADIRPPLYATFMHIAGRGGALAMIEPTVGGETGYARHIAAWHLIARAQVDGGMKTGYNGWIRANAASQPQNPLYQWMLAHYVTGDFAPVVAALMDEKYYPRDRLPADTEVCDPFVIQRDAGPDWAPCAKPAQVVWTGSDWLVVAWLLLGGLG